MRTEWKTWTRLGLATALAGAGLAGCAEETEIDDRGETGSQLSGEMGEGGEGGESGEGGIDPAAAANDPVVYGTALAIVEAHAIAARESYRAGRQDAAAEMFAHPVSEVLAEMDDVFADRGVKDFKNVLTDASTAALAGQSDDAIDARYDAIINALRAAEATAPDDGTSEAEIAARIAAEMIERAIAMYTEARASDRYEPYLDGYGFYRAGARIFADHKAAIRAEDDALHDRMAQTLALLDDAYPGAERPGTLEADTGALLASESRMLLRLSSQ